MPKKIKSSLLKAPARGIERVVDANFNRAKEGLRVCEDISRFMLDDKVLTSGYKAVRHDLTSAAVVFGLREIVKARDAAGDIGRPTTVAEAKRGSIADIFYANTQRVKESLRVLEEFAKLRGTGSAEQFKTLRYQVYGLEKKALARL
ncbi:MAG: thiamine-phosphate pyrophosphorylase [Candidatus Omnitrophica bacterium]|nr:thiamine-phosphate pyrophosphorylase [Candidatus Omnitrophota bacterium]